MNTNELKRVFQHRLSKFDHLIKMHSSDLEDIRKQQIIGAMNEISVILKTLDSE